MPLHCFFAVFKIYSFINMLFMLTHNGLIAILIELLFFKFLCFNFYCGKYHSYIPYKQSSLVSSVIFLKIMKGS